MPINEFNRVLELQWLHDRSSSENREGRKLKVKVLNDAFSGEDWSDFFNMIGGNLVNMLRTINLTNPCLAFLQFSGTVFSFDVAFAGDRHSLR